MSPQDKQALQLPHHKLIAFQVAAELLQLVARIRINDAELRQQARKSAKSAVLNTAEGAARQTLADKSRAYAIALAEGCECCAAVEVAGMLGACSPAHVHEVLVLGVRLKNLLSRLIR
ncbi:MAG: four helix bundle protein [Gemmatimonadaceae bacterium]|nr:four helix bundle protein [Gemmatimonadaceae bacterium]